jgi:hypothetical protein
MTKPIGSETVDRQIRVAKLVLAAQGPNGVPTSLLTNSRHGQVARDALVAYVRRTEPGFGEPSDETWRLVVAHLSVLRP